MKRMILVFFALTLLFQASAFTINNEEDSVAEDKKYDSVITSDAKSAFGLMNIHEVNSVYYLEIPYSLMYKPLLLASKVSATSNNKDVIAGQMPRDPQLVEFSCDDKKVYLHDGTVKAVCDSTESIYKGFKLNYIKPIIQAFPVVTVNPDSTAVVIDVSSFFCSDLPHMSPFMPESSYDSFFGAKRLTGVFQANLSSIQSFKAFPKNIIFKTRMVYSVGADPFMADVTVSLIRLADKPMKPRLYDNRIGYFTNHVQKYSEKKDASERVDYITRWDIQPKPEDLEKYKNGELVEPAKPIVYYIDDAFPLKWRSYIKDAVEDWQMAFEEIGFKNAIVARDYPDDPDFDPDDIRYSCIRYSSHTMANAMGPSWTDPRSGEILQGSVYFYHDVLKLVHNWRFIQTATVDPNVRKSVYDDDVMGPLLRYLLVHEVGHTLGLSHNMRGSYAYPVDSLRSPSFTSKYGTTASVMDYARYNYVAQPGDGVEWLLPPRLGTYDKHAIKIGYKPIFDASTPEEERPLMNKWILEKAYDPMYRYGKQEFYSFIDPAAQTESLGDDAILATKYGIKNLKLLLKNLPEWTTEEGEPYFKMSDMYNEIFMQFTRYMGHCSKYIGGQFLQYPVKGDGHPGYIPVSKSKQKEALEYVISSLREFPEWMGNPDILKLMSPSDKGLYDYQAGYVKGMVGIHTKLAVSAEPMEDVYTQYEYLHDLFNLIFDNTLNGRKLTHSDMNMEYAFVYSIFESLNFLTSPSAKGFADIQSLSFLKGLEAETILPCFYMGMGHEPDEYALASNYRETDAMIAGREICFGILKDLQPILEKRANKSKGQMQTHYAFLSYEVNKVLKAIP